MRAAVDLVDEPLLAALRGRLVGDHDARSLLERAEVHGLAGVVYPALRGRAKVDDRIARVFEMREIARELEHSAHLKLLRAIDEALTAAGVQAVALKGPLLAERLYASPASRATSDVDLLVAEADLDAAMQALATIGYVASTQPSEARFRREHHHLHLSHAKALPVELHFHAYRGFGTTLRSESLIARKLRFEGLTSIGVLEPSDELVYLAVHAAGHRLGRIGWLYDLQLLVERMTDAQIETAATRARELGYLRAVGFIADLLVELLGVDATRVSSLRHHRRRLARACMREPKAAITRSLSRFVYSLSLCDDRRTRARYVRSAVGQYWRRLFEPA